MSWTGFRQWAAVRSVREIENEGRAEARFSAAAHQHHRDPVGEATVRRRSDQRQRRRERRGERGRERKRERNEESIGGFMR